METKIWDKHLRFLTTNNFISIAFQNKFLLFILLKKCIIKYCYGWTPHKWPHNHSLLLWRKLAPSQPNTAQICSSIFEMWSLHLSTWFRWQTKLTPSLGGCESVWNKRDFTPVMSTGGNELRISHSVSASLILKIFKIDEKTEKSCNNCLGAMEPSAIEKVEKLWESISLFCWID